MVTNSTNNKQVLFEVTSDSKPDDSIVFYTDGTISGDKLTEDEFGQEGIIQVEINTEKTKLLYEAMKAFFDRK